MNAGRLSYTLANWDVATAATASGRANSYRKALMAYADIVTTALGINDVNDLTAAQMKPLYLALWADVRASAPGAVLKQVTMLPSTRLRDYPIASLTTSGTIATLVTGTPHHLETGQQAVIAGAAPTAYNGTKTVTVVDPTTLTFTIASGTAAASTTGVLRWTTGWSSRWSQAPTGADAVRTQLNGWFATQAGVAGGVDGVIDLVPAVADPADATLWATNGTAGYPTIDGVHPSPAMHAALATAYRAGVGA